CRGCLPTRVRLYQRRVDCDVHCPICENTIEDDLHVFFDCIASRECWQAAGLLSILDNNGYQQGLATDRVFAMCRNEDRATIGRVATLFWSIWHHRNDVVWNDSPKIPNQVGRIAYNA
ncbi:replication protein A 70 kDa dna-binding subunit, partial [Trifolium medium]|nr:replication protein A 70 kDa dna-binding subunit [Trifolium medium]